MTEVYRWLLTGALYAAAIFLLDVVECAWRHGDTSVAAGVMIVSALLFAAAQWTTPPRQIATNIAITHAPDMTAEFSGDAR